MARPTIMTPETIEKLKYAFSIGASDLEACMWAGIGKTALYNYQEKHPEFSEQKAALKSSPAFKAKLNVVNDLNKGDVDTAKWYLANKCSDEFNTKSTIAGDGDNPLRITLDTSKLSDDALEQIVALNDDNVNE